MLKKGTNYLVLFILSMLIMAGVFAVNSNDVHAVTYKNIVTDISFSSAKVNYGESVDVALQTTSAISLQTNATIYLEGYNGSAYTQIRVNLTRQTDGVYRGTATTNIGNVGYVYKPSWLDISDTSGNQYMDYTIADRYPYSKFTVYRDWESEVTENKTLQQGTTEVVNVYINSEPNTYSTDWLNINSSNTSIVQAIPTSIIMSDSVWVKVKLVPQNTGTAKITCSDPRTNDVVKIYNVTVTSPEMKQINLCKGEELSIPVDYYANTLTLTNSQSGIDCVQSIIKTSSEAVSGSIFLASSNTTLTVHNQGTLKVKLSYPLQDGSSLLNRLTVADSNGNALADYVISLKNHEYGVPEIVQNKDCIHHEKLKYTCINCGGTYIEEKTEYGDHVWDENYTIDQNPTCTEEGSKSRHCSICNEKTDITVIDALGHNYENVVISPTCTGDGYTLHTCSRCSDNYKDNYVDATGHSWGDWEEIEAPGCEAEGLEQRECTVCHAKEQNTEDAIGHDFASEFTVDQKATVGTDGSKSKHCSRCDAVTESTVIPAIEDNIYFADGEFTFNGSEQKPEVSIKDVNGEVIGETNYAVSYFNNTNAGTAKATVSFDSEVYEGTLKKEFVINKANPVITTDKEIKVRVKKTKQIALTDEDLGDVKFVSAKKKIATVSSAGKVKGKKIGTTIITVTVSGSANYNPGEVTIDIIVPKIIKKAALSKTSFTYNGEVQIPKVKTVNNSRKLKEGEAFEVVWPEEPINAGTYKVKISGIGKYDGSVTKTYKILKASQKITVTVPTVKVGENVQLEPDAIGSGAYTYASAAQKIATVDANGVITGKKAGTVKITITKAADGNYKKAVKTIKVTVVK